MPPSKTLATRAERRQVRRLIPPLILAKRFDEAFKLAEHVLDLGPDAEDFEGLMSPHRDAESRDFPVPVMYDLLRAAGPDGRSPWLAQLRFCLLERLRRPQEAFAQTEKLVKAPARYGWMRFHRGDMLLRAYGMLPQAVRELDATHAATPAFWKAGALAAEAALCAGDADGALRRMDALVAATRADDKAALIAWRGELRLWARDYGGALRDLDDAVERRAPLALCWRGAARLASGLPDSGLADLDDYLTQAVDDLEARVWRGEARRRKGDLAGALTDLEHALRYGHHQFFALINRALVRLAQGDRQEAARDAAAVPPEILEYFRWKTGGAEGAPLLEAVLSAAGGIRRSETYLYPLWLAADRG